MKKTMLVALTAGILSAAGAMEAREFRVQPQPRPQPRLSQPRQTHNASPGNRMGQARNHNSRPGGVHINPDYFATHFGHDHGFHFADCGPRVLGGELYFSFNGGWFGVMGPMPGDWGFQTDYPTITPRIRPSSGNIHVVVNVAPGQMTANAARIKTVSCDKYVVQYSRFCPNPLALLQCIQLFTIVSTIVSDPNPT
jgi:hypothetical protein